MVNHHKSNNSKNTRIIKLSLLIVVFGIFLTLSHTFAGKQSNENLNLTSAETDTTKVIVKLKVPGLEELTAISNSYKGIKPGEPFDSEGYQADMDLKKAVDIVADDVLAQLQGTNYHVNHRFTTIPYLALDVSVEAMTLLAKADGVLLVKEDRAWVPVEPGRGSDKTEKSSTDDGLEDLYSTKLNDSVSLIGADAAWNMGFDGTGWYVAIVDTGLRTGHEMFANKTIDEHCFSAEGECPNGLTEMHGVGAAYHPIPGVTCDIYGHGTRVTGIAVGSNGNGPNGTINGVAPGADIIAVRVVSVENATNCIVDYESDVGRALEHIYTLRNQFPIASVNLSIGYDLETDPCADIFDGGIIDAVANLKNVEIVTVAAVGNNNQCGSVVFPACISDAVAVGASNDNDNEWGNSNWDTVMVDFFAPGYQIITSKGTGNTAYVNANDPNDLWSGTSLAAPHVSGAWALVRQAAPDATWQEIYNALANTGVQVTTTCTGGGSKPRIQVDDAIISLQEITVTSPNAGISVRRGQTITIDWTTSGITGNVNVAAVGSSMSYLVATDIPYDSGPIQWTVPNDFPYGNTYIQVWQGGLFGYSGTFQVGMIDVTAPTTWTYRPGSTITFNWTSQGLTGDVIISVVTPQYSLLVESAYPISAGTYLWEVPANIPLGASYVSIGKGSVFNNSQTFYIGTMDVTFPAGGEIYGPGNTVPIDWTSQGIVGDVMVVAQSNFTSYVLSNSHPYDGTPYNWVIPANFPTGQCRIQVFQGEAMGFSGYFDIGSITVTQPTAGQTFSHGQNMTIGWNTQGITGNVMLVLQTYINPHDPNPPLGISYIINDTVPTTGSPYTWNIPTYITPGQYTVLIRQGNIEGRSGVITVSQ